MAELTRAIALALLTQDVDDLQQLSRLLRNASHVVSQALESASREHNDRLLAMTPREKDVLDEMQWHQTVQRIAQVLFVSPNTVKTHIRSIYLKLEVATRDQAIKKAYALGMLRT
ncbi:MAG: helix-turn-helix transcriptional regulator [Leifsonia sp.]